MFCTYFCWRGISKIEHADDYFKNGADKIILGSKIILNKEIISKISSKYGNQSIIQSIDIKKNESSEYNLVINSGKELTKINPENAIKTALENGAGEILINNVDFDGSLLGYDLKIIKNLTENLIPNFWHLEELVIGVIFWIFLTKLIHLQRTQNIFHFTDESINSAKKYLNDQNILIRL